MFREINVNLEQIASLTPVQKRRLRGLLLRCEDPAALLPLGELCASLARRGVPLEDLLLEEGLEDLHREHLSEAVQAYRRHRQGYLYLAVNACLARGLHKIGATRVSPEARRRSLRTAGVPGRFELVKAWPVHDAFAAETACRSVLYGRRVERDFYAGGYAELSTALDQVVANEYAISRRMGINDLSYQSICNQNGKPNA